MEIGGKQRLINIRNQQRERAASASEQAMQSMHVFIHHRGRSEAPIETTSEFPRLHDGSRVDAWLVRHGLHLLVYPRVPVLGTGAGKTLHRRAISHFLI